VAGEQLELNFNAPVPSLPQLWTPDDIYDNADQSTIEEFVEDSRLERKRAKVQRKALSEYVSMWANTQPAGGIVVIGVEDDGCITGCKSTEDEHLTNLETVGELCPDARIEFKRVLVQNHNKNEDYVILLRVHYRDDKLVEITDGSAFIREGDKKRKLTEAEKREIRLNRGELDCESEPVNLTFPDDFDMGLLNEYLEAFIRKRQLDNRYTIEDILKLSKLGTDAKYGFQPNLACAMLFAKDPRAVVPGAFIRVMRYDGTREQFGTRLNSVADRIFEGPIARQIQDAELYIETQVRNFTRLGPDGKFITKPEYPKEVWLEGIVNAVVHRSYNLRQMNIYVKMFEDKMVVESPGSFMPPTTEETVYDAHNPRNPHLMWGLFYFDYVQCAFEGTRRMRAGMRQANLPDPHFVQRQSGTFSVTVSLENDVQHRKQFVRSEAAAAIAPEEYDTLNESEKMIVNYLVDNNSVNVTDAGLVIAKDWRETKIVLEGLKTKGVIDRSPGKHRSRHRYYYLKIR